MTFKHEDEQYKITFFHGKFELPTNPSVMARGTWCRVAKSDLFMGLVGYSYCHPNDNFCRETGRKLALKKALHNCSRAFRTAAWKAYWERPRESSQQHLDRLLKDKGLTEEAVAKARQELLATAPKGGEDQKNECPDCGKDFATCGCPF